MKNIEKLAEIFTTYELNHLVLAVEAYAGKCRTERLKYEHMNNAPVDKESLQVLVRREDVSHSISSEVYEVWKNAQ